MGNILTLPDGTPAYEVQPDGDCKGGLILIHEVWGLVDHIKDVANRFGHEGYYVLAPNLISDTDIEKYATPELQRDLFNPEKRNAVQPQLRQMMAPLQAPDFGDKTLAKVRGCFEYVYKQPVVKQRVAIAGYCFGGTYSFNLAVAEPRLKAAVPYYGHADQSADELKAIKCPVLYFLGEKDENLMSKLPDLKTRMAAAGVDFAAQVYPDCGHAFFNDTNPFAYNEAAAKDAWQKTLDFLAKNLG